MVTCRSPATLVAEKQVAEQKNPFLPDVQVAGGQHLMNEHKTTYSKSCPPL